MQMITLQFTLTVHKYIYSSVILWMIIYFNAGGLTFDEETGLHGETGDNQTENI